MDKFKGYIGDIETDRRNVKPVAPPVEEAREWLEGGGV